MSADGREGRVLALIGKHGRRLSRLADTRCTHDGRLLGAAYRLPDGVWIWTAGHREPPQVARINAAAHYLDAVDECRCQAEVQACYDAASEVLSSDVRPVARPAVMRIDAEASDAGFFHFTPGFSMVLGHEFAVSEVSCGCRRQFYLDVYGLAKAALANATSVEPTPTHVPPLLPDLPQREVQRLLQSLAKARA